MSYVGLLARALAMAVHVRRNDNIASIGENGCSEEHCWVRTMGSETVENNDQCTSLASRNPLMPV